MPEPERVGDVPGWIALPLHDMDAFAAQLCADAMHVVGAEPDHRAHRPSSRPHSPRRRTATLLSTPGRRAMTTMSRSPRASAGTWHMSRSPTPTLWSDRASYGRAGGWSMAHGSTRARGFRSPSAAASGIVTRGHPCTWLILTSLAPSSGATEHVAVTSASRWCHNGA